MRGSMGKRTPDLREKGDSTSKGKTSFGIQEDSIGRGGNGCLKENPFLLDSRFTHSEEKFSPRGLLPHRQINVLRGGEVRTHPTT